jgi:signal transduction histidine kinase
MSIGGWLERVWRGAGAGLSRYADWLATLSWKRFALLALLALAATAILSEVPPFDTHWGPQRTIVEEGPPRKTAAISDDDIEVQIDKNGIRVRPRAHAGAASAASAPASGSSAAQPAAPGVPTPPMPPTPPIPDINIKLPPGAGADEVRDAIQDAKDEIRDAMREAQKRPRVRISKGFRLGDHMVDLMVVLIISSIFIKAMVAGRHKAEARAAQATEMAEGEALKRQVVEARMAAMRAQVEPHFLFNTLASIDHLIETDPARASRMQKNLIALLRASMPTMREAAASGVPRDLSAELAVVRPYLEILRMRMEERLAVEIDVPDGLMSAEFPPMMMQSLVENAIKHGLEPKPEGGALRVKAEIVHGKLAVTVADTGLGFGKAGGTAGTGVGLANIRERLELLYGAKATLTISDNRPSGTVVTVTVPYVAHHTANA